jgi:hypothetical protein
MPKFEKGNPGGPGRPAGSRNRVNQILDELAVEGAETLVKKMIAVAAEGDRVAARLVLNRIWSAPKGRTVPVEMPEIRAPRDLLAAHTAVSSALGAGTITPQEAASLAAVLETHRRAFELVVQQQEVVKLEDDLRRTKAKLW